MLKKVFFLFLVVFIGSQTNVFGQDQDTIRVLAIGNSFSEDAVENYLHDLGKADGVTLIIANACIGGTSLEQHWNNAQSDATAYSLRKVEANGEKKRIENMRLSEAITHDKWDYITMQQVSQKAGLYDTFFPYLPNLLNYVKSKATNPNVTFALQMTWAYAQSSNHSGFANYGRDQFVMYDAIVATFPRVAAEVNINTIIPSGTAVQNARTSSLGDTLCRDGFHLDKGIGRYLAACTWYAKLTGRSVVGNTFVLPNVPAENIRIVQQAAENAVKNPFEITRMSSDAKCE